MTYLQSPQTSAHLLATLAATPQNLEFICFCIENYFERLLSASMRTLARHGIRPIIAPMAAQAALQRVDGMNYCPGWFHALIADDAEAAKLALRAIKTYSHHYEKMPNKHFKNQISQSTKQIQKISKQLTNLLTVLKQE